MKNLGKFALALFAGSFLLSSCGDDDDNTNSNPQTPAPANTSVQYFDITENTTWVNDSIYELAGRIFVTNGATLTIEAGTIIKGQPGSGTNASALVVARGSKLMANGTASAPIIFTTVADNIQPGQIASPNLSATENGYWGGLIILGNARCSFEGGVTEASIEGIPATDENGKYGGSNDADNSGSIRFISIRHGGSNIGEGNEINGLTLGGVGSGTVIENVEIVGNQDDGIEFFGGTVSVTNAVVWNNGDDAIDTDQAWAGTLSNFVVINPGDEAFELDGPEGPFTSTGHTITAGTVFAGNASGLVDFDDNSDVRLNNIYFTNIKAPAQGATAQDVEGYSGYLANSGYVSAGWEATLPAGTTKETFFVGGSANITTVVSSATAAGANLSAFDGWAWSRVSGGF